MNRLFYRLRYLVKRENADHYLLFMLLSFAASVTLTRLFLELTGYPQIGGGKFHIAHVLWGGLLLFIAALAPLIFANRWVYPLGAILSGVGVGLFIDEVGKFITANNNYFIPLAAPIIYGFFLLTVLLYLRVREPPSGDTRAELYHVLDTMEEVLDHDLDPQERSSLEKRLVYIATQTDQPEFARLADSLLDFLYSDASNLASTPSGAWAAWQARWDKFESAWLTRLRLKAFLAGGLIALGVTEILDLIRSLPVGRYMFSLQATLTRLVSQGQISSMRGLDWFAASQALELSVGLLLVAAAVLLILGKDRLGISIGFFSLLLSLTSVDLLNFYFNQFSTVLATCVQFLLILGLNFYRRRFEPAATAQSQGQELKAKTP